MSIASKRAKAAINRALTKLRAATRGRGGRYSERVADIGVPLSWDQARDIERTPDQLRHSAQALGQIASQLSALASHIDQDRHCPKCDERITGEIGAAATIRHAVAQLQALARDHDQHADQVDDAADQIGQPGATLWFGHQR